MKPVVIVPLSERALIECRLAVQHGSGDVIDSDALNVLEGLLREHFQRVLDEPNGLKQWSRDKWPLLRNAQLIGMLASILGRVIEPSRTSVGVLPLGVAFALIRHICTVGSGTELTTYCREATPESLGPGVADSCRMLLEGLV